MRFSKKTREEIKEEIEEETRQINGVYIKKELEKEYQKDIDFFQMVASIFESFESYQKGVAKKKGVGYYKIYLDNLAKESNNKSFPNYQKQRANEDGFDSHADKLKSLAKKSGFDLTNNSIKQNNIETKVMDKNDINSLRDFLNYNGGK